MRGRSVFSAISRALTVKAFETCASCASAPVHGLAKAGHAVNDAKSRDKEIALITSFLIHCEELIGPNIVHHLYSPTRPLQFDFLDDRIRAQSKVDPRIVRTRVTSSCRDVVVLHNALFRCNFDSCSHPATVAFDSHCLAQNPMISAAS